MSDKYTPVTFLDSEGNEISNDPVWLARRTLAQHGVEDITETSTEKASAEAEATSTSDDESIAEDYSKFDGKQLKELAKERDISIKGLKTVGEVRQALIAADAATEDEDEDDDSSGEAAE